MAGKSVLLVGLCVGWIGALLASVLMIHMIVEDVNLKIPEAQQFGYTDWYVGKMGKLKKQYRRSYPEGRLVSLFNICTTLSVVFFLAFIWRAGFFR